MYVHNSGVDWGNKWTWVAGDRDIPLVDLYTKITDLSRSIVITA